MDRATILNDLKHQRDAITAAIAALTGTSRTKSGRRSSLNAANATGPRRRLSAAARKRISEAAKARWAKAKKAGRNRL